MEITRATIISVHYLCRNQYYKQALDECDSYKKQFGDDPIIQFYKLFTATKLGYVSEAIHGLSSLKSRREINVAAIAALIFCHHQSNQIDETEIYKLQMELQNAMDEAPPSAILHLALFYSLSEEHQDARRLVDMVSDNYSDKYCSTIVAKGWIRISSPSEVAKLESEKYFDKALEAAKPDLEAFLGKAKFLESVLQYTRAIEYLNRAVVSFPDFHHVIIEKAKLLIYMGDWSQVFETCQRIQSSKKDSLDYYILTSMYQFIEASNWNDIFKQLDTLVSVLQEKESKNHPIYVKVAKLISRLSVGNSTCCALALKLVQYASKLYPNHSEYITEEGYIHLLLQDFKSAEVKFNTALEIDESNLHANRGLIYCALQKGKYDEAGEILDFLNEVGETLDTIVSFGTQPELNYLNSLLSWRRDKNESKSVEWLSSAVAQLEKETKALQLNYQFFFVFDPILMLNISRELMVHSPSEPVDPMNPLPNSLELAIRVLESIISSIPGCQEAQIMFAKAQYLSRSFDFANQIINKILKMDSTNANAHFLSAFVAYEQENYVGALNSLERALSYNFKIKESIQYNLLKARVLGSMGEDFQALSLLEICQNQAEQMYKSDKGYTSIPMQDRISIFLELADLHNKLNHEAECNKTITEATSLFKHTQEEDRILIAKARILAKRNEVDTAINILKTIPPKSKYFTKARIEVANINLTMKNDKNAFTKAYEEIVEKVPMSLSSFAYLGDAYINVQEPEKAIKAYQQALEMDPDNAMLRNKIGTALISTHNYTDAVNYYKEALNQNPSRFSLYYDLASLYNTLKNYDDALQTIQELIDKIRSRKDQTPLHVKTLQLMASVQLRALRPSSIAIEVLKSAKNLQTEYVNNFRGSQQDAVLMQKKIISIICCDIGREYLNIKDFENAIQALTESLVYDEANEKSLEILAQYFMEKNNLEQCSSYCLALLRVNPLHERAAMMLADIRFRENKYEEAIEYFDKLLENTNSNKSENYRTLIELFHLLKRAGRLHECEKYLDRYKENSDTGLHFAKGIYYRFSKNYREAIKELNQCRVDLSYADDALIQMIEIYIDVDNFLDAFFTENSSFQMEYIATAEQLLLNVNKKSLQDRVEIIRGYIQLAKNNKTDIDKALQLFITILQKDKDNLPALVGVSIGLHMTKQTVKSKTNLKRITKFDFNFKFADDFERGLLLLADMEITQGKLDVALTFLKQVLQINKSCIKAWDMQGLIFEKNQQFDSAFECYESAWKLSQENDPSIGFKLCVNYLKAKKYISAIDISTKILKKHPNYPKIRKEVLDKARAMLRA